MKTTGLEEMPLVSPAGHVEPSKGYFTDEEAVERLLDAIVPVDGGNLATEHGSRRTPRKGSTGSAGSKRKGKSPGRPLPKRRQPPPEEDEDDDDEEEEDEDKGDDDDDDDDDDDEDGGGDGPGPSDGEEDDGGDGTALVVRGEVRDESLPGSTTNRFPLYWQVQYKRRDRGSVDTAWCLGGHRWAKRERAATWGIALGRQFTGRLSLSTFVENLGEYAVGRVQGVERTPAHGVNAAQGPDCPLPGIMDGMTRVAFRTATKGETGLAKVLPSLLKFTFTQEATKEKGAKGPAIVKQTEAYMLWSLWSVEAAVLARVVRRWNHERPGANLYLVDRLLAQVATPSADSFIPEEEMTALLDGIHYNPPNQPPAGAPARNPAVVLPAL